MVISNKKRHLLGKGPLVQSLHIKFYGKRGALPRIYRPLITNFQGLDVLDGSERKPLTKGKVHWGKSVFLIFSRKIVLLPPTPPREIVVHWEHKTEKNLFGL